MTPQERARELRDRYYLGRPVEIDIADAIRAAVREALKDSSGGETMPDDLTHETTTLEDAFLVLHEALEHFRGVPACDVLLLVDRELKWKIETYFTGYGPSGGPCINLAPIVETMPQSDDAG